MNRIEARILEGKLDALDRRVRDLELAPSGMIAGDDGGFRIFTSPGMNFFDSTHPDDVMWQASPWSMPGRILAGVSAQEGCVTARHASVAKFVPIAAPRYNAFYSVTVSCVIDIATFQADPSGSFAVYLQALPLLADYDPATASWSTWSDEEGFLGHPAGAEGMLRFDQNSPSQFIIAGRRFSPPGNVSSILRTHNVVIPVSLTDGVGSHIYGVAFTMRVSFGANVSGSLYLTTDGRACVIEADLALRQAGFAWWGFS